MRKRRREWRDEEKEKVRDGEKVYISSLPGERRKARDRNMRERRGGLWQRGVQLLSAVTLFRKATTIIYEHTLQGLTLSRPP